MSGPAIPRPTDSFPSDWLTLHFFLLKYLASMFQEYYIPRMEWHVEYTDEFGAWWDSLTAEEQEVILRTANLLIGGDKTGNDRWYDTYVPLADQLYDDYLIQLRREGRLPDG